MLHRTKPYRKKFILASYAFLLVVLAGLGWLGWRSTAARTAQPTATPYTTARVQFGDLFETISGSAALTAGETADLVLTSGGVLAEMNVAPGDAVQKGDVLAALDNRSQLELALRNREMDLKNAQKSLDDLLSDGEEHIASALANLAAAKETAAEAEKNVHHPGDSRCNPDLTMTYYFAYITVQQRVEQWEYYLSSGKTGYGTDFILSTLAPMRRERDRAYTNMTYCQGYTADEIETSQANQQLAAAQLQQAQAAYQSLLDEQGLDPDQVTLAEARVKSARMQVEKAHSELVGAVITAPFDGVVLSTAAQAGDQVSAGVLITIANMNAPQVEVTVDETDLVNFKAGCTAEVTFDAVTDRTFQGVVSAVSPVLTTSNDVAAASGMVNLSGAQWMPGRSLPLGLAGTADITCTDATGTLLIPVSALHEEENNPAYVFVLIDGTPIKYEVEVGIRSASQVQILSGLRSGEWVVTGGNDSLEVME